MASGSFTSSSKSQTLFMCYFYLAIGPLAVIANLLNLAVFLTDPRMRRFQVLSIALYLGELTNGVSYILTGYGRLKLYQAGLLFTPTTVKLCNTTHNWVVFLIMGTEIPAMLVIVISLERILAVTKPAWFSRTWKVGTKFACICVVVVVEMVSLVASGLSGRHDPRTVSSRHCAIVDSTSKAYSTWHFSFVVAAYVLSFASLVVVYLATRHSPEEVKQKNQSLTRRQQLLMMIIVTASSIVMVAAPGVLMMGVLWQVFDASDLAVGIVYSATGVNSVVTTIINYLFREDYRRSFANLMKCSLFKRRNFSLQVLTSTAASVRPQR